MIGLLITVLSAVLVVYSAARTFPIAGKECNQNLAVASR